VHLCLGIGGVQVEQLIYIIVMNLSQRYANKDLTPSCILQSTVLMAFEQRTTRYRVRERLAEASTRTHNWGLNKTGTIDASRLLQSREEIQKQEEIDIWGVSEEVLQVHGVLPGKKEEGITRLLYVNANGIHDRLGGNEE